MWLLNLHTRSFKLKAKVMCTCPTYCTELWVFWAIWEKEILAIAINSNHLFVPLNPH